MNQIIEINDFQHADDNLNLGDLNVYKFKGCLFIWNDEFEEWYNDEDTSPHARPLKEWLEYRKRCMYRYKLL